MANYGSRWVAPNNPLDLELNRKTASVAKINCLRLFQWYLSEFGKKKHFFPNSERCHWKMIKMLSSINHNSPGILSSKVGQPATNCKRIFLNGFWPRNMSSVTYQKSPKIRAGNVDKKQVFFRALYCAAWKRGCMYCLLCCSSLKPRAALDQQDR